ncbi:hypothetical protein ABPG77_006192 [Micractinium sp. CCAP 211/92]
MQSLFRSSTADTEPPASSSRTVSALHSPNAPPLVATPELEEIATVQQRLLSRLESAHAALCPPDLAAARSQMAEVVEELSHSGAILVTLKKELDSLFQRLRTLRRSLEAAAPATAAGAAAPAAASSGAAGAPAVMTEDGTPQAAPPAQLAARPGGRAAAELSHLSPVGSAAAAASAEPPGREAAGAAPEGAGAGKGAVRELPGPDLPATHKGIVGGIAQEGTARQAVPQEQGVAVQRKDSEVDDAAEADAEAGPRCEAADRPAVEVPAAAALRETCPAPSNPEQRRTGE